MRHQSPIRLAVVLMIALFALCNPYPTVYAQPDGQDSLSLNQYAMIVADISPVPLFDGPESLIVAGYIAVGTTVRIDHIWARPASKPYLVHSEKNPALRGWIGGQFLLSIAALRNRVGNVTTCAEARDGASICGKTLIATPDTELSIQFDHFGVTHGAYLQLMVVVDGEQYSSRPVKMTEPCGSLSLGLLDMPVPPHRIVGKWEVALIIDNEWVYKGTVTILPPHYVLRPLPAYNAPLPGNSALRIEGLSAVVK